MIVNARKIVPIAALWIVAAMAGCTSSDDGPETSTSPTPSPGSNMTAKPRDILITAYDTPAAGQTKLMRFEGNVAGKVNETVNITLKTAAGQRSSHNLRIVDHAGASIDMAGTGGKTVTITFTKAGTFKFYCNINPGPTAQTSHDSLGMNGQMTVSA